MNINDSASIEQELKKAIKAFAEAQHAVIIKKRPITREQAKRYHARLKNVKNQISDLHKFIDEKTT